MRLPPSKKRRAIETYVLKVVHKTLPILPYDEAAASWHGKERARLQGMSVMPAFADGQIAAIARVNELVLVTRNVTDFEPFREIQVENWFES